MFFHPGIIALLLSEGLLILYLVFVDVLAINILRKWNPTDASEQQLSLERRIYLISTVMGFVMGINLTGLFLFIYTVDDLHRLFVGAMCATGTLNANPIGWWALATKVVMFFVSALWLIINYVDQKAEDYPLVKLKYAVLLLISPIFILDFALTILYFNGLNPSIITSCCGALFSESGTKLTSTLSTLPAYPLMVVFFILSAGLLILFLVNMKWNIPLLRYTLSLVGVTYLVLAIASVISFVSVYYYELPTHHCPFDILQKEYHYVGYAIYSSLFVTALCAIATGMVEPFRHFKSLFIVLRTFQKRLTLIGLLSLLVFIGFVVYPMLFSQFSLFGY